MSDFEIVSLFHQLVEVANASMTNFLTVLLAMLVASYLAADKLDRKTAVMVLAIYSAFLLGLINELYSGYRDFAAAGIEMAGIGQQPGSSLAWHPTVMNGGAGLQFIPLWVATMAVAAYVCSIWFFFHMRGKGRAGPPLDVHAEIGATD